MPAALIALALAAPARSEAWLPQPGRELVIVGLAPRANPGAPSIELYRERGLAPGLALVASPTLGLDARGTEPFERSLGIRTSLPAAGRWTGSIQLSLVDGYGAVDPDHPQRPLRHFVSAEPRIAFGRDLPQGLWTDLAVGVRPCPGARGWTATTRWSAAMGLHLDRGSEWIAKSYGASQGCGEPGQAVQISRLWSLGPDVRLEVGWRAYQQTAGVQLDPDGPGLRYVRQEGRGGLVIAMWVSR